jgi:hypothetical protein
MAYPTLPFLERTGEPLKTILTRFLAGLTGFLKAEHKDDGTHGWNWQSVTFNAAHYTGSGGMTWTVASGNVAVFRYMLIGKTMFVMGVFNTTSVTAPLGTMLKVRIPGGYTAANQMRDTNQATDSAVGTASQVRVDAGSTTIDIMRQDGANWTAAAGTTSVRVHTFFEVQ